MFLKLKNQAHCTNYERQAAEYWNFVKSKEMEVVAEILRVKGRNCRKIFEFRAGWDLAVTSYSIGERRNSRRGSPIIYFRN
jgi:hypothetical protein